MGSAVNDAKDIAKKAAPIFTVPYIATTGALTSLGLNNKVSNPAMPQVPAIPPPPIFKETTPFINAQERAKRLASLKYGLASTIQSNPLLAPAATNAPSLKPNLGT